MTKCAFIVAGQEDDGIRNILIYFAVTWALVLAVALCSYDPPKPLPDPEPLLEPRHTVV